VKSLGLLALMGRGGRAIPVDVVITETLFTSIYTDIGDEQSIERDLSTFSGHLMNINTFVERADGDSLILLDELFTGTDPIQGAALATALLDELIRLGARVVVTTHLETLKTLAYQKDAYANASMGFDLEDLSPTYKVTYGLPGSSYALRIAERLSFPGRIVERAQEILSGEEHQSVEEILTSLEDKRDEMEREQRRLRHARQEAESSKRKFQDKYERLLAKEKDLVHEQTRRLKGELDKARTFIREQIAELQRRGVETRERVTNQELEDARAELERTTGVIDRATEFTRPVKTGPKGLARVRAEDISEGMEVYAQTFNRKGTVLQFDEGSSEVMVQLGFMKAKVALTDLFFPDESSRQAKRSHQPRRKSPASSGGDSGGGGGRTEHILLPQTAENTVDLRGLRVDEALEKVELFLDALYRANQDGAYIIHGHGSGALKRAVRGWLPTSRYVDNWRRGERGEAVMA